MSLWSKLFGSKPKTEDDELLDAALKLGKMMGWDKARISEKMHADLALGISKKDLAAIYNKQLEK